MQRMNVFVATLLSLPMWANAEDRINIRTNPFMVFGEFVHLEVDVRVGEDLSVGPVFLVNGFEPTFDVGLRVSYYEQGAFGQGWVTSVAATGGEEVYDRSYSGEFDEDVEGYKTRTVAKLSANHAYLWRWKTFNTTAGLGIRAEYRDQDRPVSLHSDLQLTIGWAR